MKILNCTKFGTESYRSSFNTSIHFDSWNTGICFLSTIFPCSLYIYSTVVLPDHAPYLLWDFEIVSKTLLYGILSTGYSPNTFSQKQIRMGHHSLFLTKLCWLIPTSFLVGTSKLFLCSEELELSWQANRLLSSPFFCLQKIVTTLCQLSSSSLVLPKF